MKKTIKIIALCLSLVAFTALFAGCDYLDEMKANHAILSEDKETITFRGETYKILTYVGDLYWEYAYSYNDSVTVTDADVPVLLKNIMCHDAYYNSKSDIFCVRFDADTTENIFINSYSEGGGVYYCNEKDYDKYLKAIEENELNRIGFEYEVFNDSYYYYTLETASQEVSDEILGYIENPEKMTKEVFDKVSEDYYTEYLQSTPYKCDSEGLLVEMLEGYDIARDSDSNAYLMNYLTERAVKLSDDTAKALKDEYYYGDYQDIENEDTDSIGVIKYLP